MPSPNSKNPFNSFMDNLLLADIEDAKKRFEASRIAPIIRQSLIAESNRHSDLMEHPNPKEQEARTLENLAQAWNWAIERFDGKVTDDLVRDIAYRINGGTQNWGYRLSRVRISGQHTLTRPQAQKIPHLMNHVFEVINNWGLHPIHQAVTAHLHIANIHPFEDGNGRTARLVQNLLLHHAGYAPATITDTERPKYLHMIDASVKAYMYRESFGGDDKRQQTMAYDLSQPEKAFYNFLGQRVLRSFEEGLTEMDTIPVYQATLNTDNTSGYLPTIQGRLQAHFKIKNHSLPWQVRIDTATNRITIVGEEDKELLRRLIREASPYQGEISMVSLKSRMAYNGGYVTSILTNPRE